MLSSRPKVLFIGFNKTATTSLHRLFADSGYTGHHHNMDGVSLGLSMQHNVRAQQPLLAGFDDVDVYIDFTYLTNDRYVEGIEYFELLHRDHADAYFILQARSERAWLRSRINHPGFVARARQVLGLSESRLLEYWQDLRTAHFAKVLRHFAGHQRFLYFDIDHTPVDDLVAFVQPHYALDKRFWRRHNQTAPAAGGAGPHSEQSLAAVREA